MNKETAYLSNDNRFTIFKTEDSVIRFVAPYSLERYTQIKEWDNGYLVVMAKYSHNETEEEEYIDMLPILRNLYIDPTSFLKPIKKVELFYE